MDTRETTVLFAAAIGGADLYAKAGDVAAADALARCMGVLGEASSKAGARIVKRTPDKLMALAGSADIAVEAAAALHQAMMRCPPLAGVRLALGVAFHHGPVIQKDADVFGDTVNLAARLVELAGRGQIITTRETARDLGGLYRPWIRDLYATDIKGRSEKVELVELVWQADPDETATTLTVPTKKLDTPAAGALILVYRGSKTVRRRQRDSITLGRDEKCGLIVHADDASRLHCTIERKHDKFVLVDHSTNGTYVTIEGAAEVLVQREEFALARRGFITLGQPKSASKEIVEFSVE